MEELLKEIEKGLEVGLYQTALSMTLCLPDICGALESENGRASGEKYKAWFNEYIEKTKIGRITADDCYYFRCSFLHQYTTEHNKSNYEKIIFLEPNDTISMHNNVLEGALNIDINIFCISIIEAVIRWKSLKQETEEYIKNYDKTFKKHPNGISPYIVGIPVYG